VPVFGARHRIGVVRARAPIAVRRWGRTGIMRGMRTGNQNRFGNRQKAVRPALVVICVALSLLGAGCNRSTGAAAPLDPVDPPTLAEYQKPPYATGVVVGESYRYVLHTHCGIVQTQITGTLWEADPPQVVEGASPPPGWNNPFASGKLRLLSEDRAEFVDGDSRATFRRASATPHECD
jgi:hypothetical protein